MGVILQSEQAIFCSEFAHLAKGPGWLRPGPGSAGHHASLPATDFQCGRSMASRCAALARAERHVTCVMVSDLILPRNDATGPP